MDKWVEEMCAKAPLIRFSVYSHMQATVVRDLGVEIIQLLDANIVVDHGLRKVTNTAIWHGKLWLWVVGTFEVIRTMDQHSSCFSERLAKDVAAFKRRIAAVRVPFTKQEIAGSNGKAIQADGSISGIDFEAKDVHHEINGQTVSMRALMTDFIALFEGIRPDDVTRDIRVAQAERPARARTRQAPQGRAT